MATGNIESGRGAAAFKRNAGLAVELGLCGMVVSLLAACGAGGEGNNGNAVMPPTTGLLQSMSIAPAASSVAACTPVRYSATGSYSDGTQADVTGGVYWEIDPASSDVAIANARNGQVVGLKRGSAVVTAWTGGGIGASAVLNVTGGSLDAIALTPASSTIAGSATQAYSAIATCSSGTLDISAMNIWTSSNSAVAAVFVTGTASAVAPGSTVITATAGAVAASAVLNVQ
jgi:hypothetical protein